MQGDPRQAKSMLEMTGTFKFICSMDREESGIYKALSQFSFGESWSAVNSVVCMIAQGFVKVVLNIIHIVQRPPLMKVKFLQNFKISTFAFICSSNPRIDISFKGIK